MNIFHNVRIAEVYKVKRRPSAKERGLEDYYCTILKNVIYPHIKCKYMTYIPNLFTRPLDQYCNLKSRVSYVGTFEEFGHLLFNQDHEKQLSGNTKNEFNTKMNIKNYADTIHSITSKV